MTDTKTFTDGYIDGWQSVRGKGAEPEIPAHVIPAGMTPYQAGFEQGKAKAEDSLKPSSN